MTLIDAVKIALGLENTTLYDQQLDLYISSAKTELEVAGIKEQDESSENFKTYCTAVSMHVKILLYPDAPDENLKKSLIRLTKNLKLKIGNYA
jgi:hypothetical protein